MWIVDVINVTLLLIRLHYIKIVYTYYVLYVHYNICTERISGQIPLGHILPIKNIGYWTILLIVKLDICK